MHYPSPGLEYQLWAKMDAAALGPRLINLEDSWTTLGEGRQSQDGQLWARERHATDQDDGREWHERSLCMMAF